MLFTEDDPDQFIIYPDTMEQARRELIPKSKIMEWFESLDLFKKISHSKYDPFKDMFS